MLIANCFVVHTYHVWYAYRALCSIAAVQAKVFRRAESEANVAQSSAQESATALVFALVIMKFNRIDPN